MVLGALAVAEDEQALTEQIIELALESIPLSLRAYAPDGAFPEGPTYWQYGTAYTCLTIAALDSALGPRHSLHEAPGLDRTGYYRICTVGPTGRYFNYADGGSGHGPALRWRC